MTLTSRIFTGWFVDAAFFIFFTYIFYIFFLKRGRPHFFFQMQEGKKRRERNWQLSYIYIERDTSNLIFCPSNFFSLHKKEIGQLFFVLIWRRYWNKLITKDFNWPISWWDEIVRCKSQWKLILKSLIQICLNKKDDCGIIVFSFFPYFSFFLKNPIKTGMVFCLELKKLFLPPPKFHSRASHKTNRTKSRLFWKCI